MSKKILITDDEKEIAELVALCLKNEGYTVFTAYTGMQTEKIISDENINLAILDIMLPGTNGFSLLRKIYFFHNNAYR